MAKPPRLLDTDGNPVRLNPDRPNQMMADGGYCPLPRPDKGQTANPSGLSRPSMDAIRYAREKSKTALITAMSIMVDEAAKNADRLKACEIILDRGLGKPVQTSVNVSEDLDSALPYNVLMIHARKLYGLIRQAETEFEGDVLDVKVLQEEAPGDGGDGVRGTSCPPQEEEAGTVQEEGEEEEVVSPSPALPLTPSSGPS